MPVRSHIVQVKVAVRKRAGRNTAATTPSCSRLGEDFSVQRFCPSVGLRPFEAIFQVYDYLLLPPFSEHYLPSEDHCGQQDRRKVGP